jgi:hypothetical protein
MGSVSRFSLRIGSISIKRFRGTIKDEWNRVEGSLEEKRREKKRIKGPPPSGDGMCIAGRGLHPV